MALAATSHFSVYTPQSSASVKQNDPSIGKGTGKGAGVVIYDENGILSNWKGLLSQQRMKWQPGRE